MQIENEFHVEAPADRVYAFLLDVNRVVTCMPGAELAEVVDPSTFKGRVKVKVGPITVAYQGTARITDRDDAARRAVLQAEGRETTGPGSARGTATMTVEEAGVSSQVKLVTDLRVAGRVANFGRGVMEDVSRRLVGQMSDCIKAHLEADAAEASSAEKTAEPAAAAAAPGAVPPPGVSPPPGTVPPPGAAPRPQPAKPVNALSLFFAVLWDRIKRLFRRG